MPLRFIDLGLTRYPIALMDMDIALKNIQNGADECVFLTEHEPLYSAGKSFKQQEFIYQPKYPVYYPKRGGRITVHSPGQLVIYPIINLRKRCLNVHDYVSILQSWIVDVLRKFHVSAHLSAEGVGVWINDAKIGFVGLRIEKGVAFHGLCVNISNNLSLFDAIIPCGLSNLKTTSLTEQGVICSMKDVKNEFVKKCLF